MKIEISPDEYRTLLDILHIADVVMSGHRRQPDKRTERHRSLVQKLYSLSASQDPEHLFLFDPVQNKYAPTAHFEESTVAHPLLDEFGDHLFWEELIGRLAMRDAARAAGGVELLQAMTDGERQRLEGPIRHRYSREFALNGVANLTVMDRFNTAEGEPIGTSD